MISIMARIKFYGSQIGSHSTTTQSYTGAPARLLREDILSALSLWWSLPYILWPTQSQLSGSLSELNLSAKNLWCCFLHVLLLIMQIPFLLSIPIWFIFPAWWVVLGCTVFWFMNESICFLINGTELEYPSDPKYAQRTKSNEHEQWIFLNGVAVGEHWIKKNVDRLALTFGRPVLGVHNKTNGILFDVIQCLIQRNFNYATADIRDCYAIVKRKIYDQSLSKIVFILHSQGGIEGTMIIDWLLQEVPQDLLAKLEVYTFGNAANHFNNPYQNLLSQHAALKHPTVPTTTSIQTLVHYHEPLPAGSDDTMTGRILRSKQESSSGKAIRYIEHYANTVDFVAQWGVLRFTRSLTASPTSPRYMGRVFERPGKGHQLNQHYLDAMFPLKACPQSSDDTPCGIGGSGYLGADESANEFMDSVLEFGAKFDAAAASSTPKSSLKADKTASTPSEERESWEISFLGTQGARLNCGEEDVLLRDMCSTSKFSVSKEISRTQEGFRVRDLSRLWLYVNGKSPKDDDMELGIARTVTF